MEQLKVGVSGRIIRSHEENGITVIDEFQLDGASIIAPNPFTSPLTGNERKTMNRELDRAYSASSGKSNRP